MPSTSARLNDYELPRVRDDPSEAGGRGSRRRPPHSHRRPWLTPPASRTGPRESLIAERTPTAGEPLSVMPKHQRPRERGLATRRTRGCAAALFLSLATDV